MEQLLPLCSVTDILRQSLSEHGISISCPAGFNNKPPMLKAIWNRPKSENQDQITSTTQAQPQFNAADSFQQRKIAIIGAGIAGLTCAYAFARRGHQVTIYDQSAPLAGASGNPLALLNPRLGQIEQSARHLVTLAWQYAMPHYEKFKAFRPIHVNQLALKADDDLLELAAQYPPEIFATEKENISDIETVYPSLKLLRAGTISPHQLRDQILEHALIQFQHAEVSELTKTIKAKSKNPSRGHPSTVFG